MTERKEIIANAELIRRTLCNTDALQEEKRRLESEMAVLVDMVNNCIAENARIAQDQEEYQKRYDGMVAKYDAAKTKFDETIAAISAKEAQNARLTAFVKALRSGTASSKTSMRAFGAAWLNISRWAGTRR